MLNYTTYKTEKKLSAGVKRIVINLLLSEMFILLVFQKRASINMFPQARTPVLCNEQSLLSQRIPTINRKGRLMECVTTNCKVGTRKENLNVRLQKLFNTETTLHVSEFLTEIVF